jgi:hypothetical protein
MLLLPLFHAGLLLLRCLPSLDVHRKPKSDCQTPHKLQPCEPHCPHLKHKAVQRCAPLGNYKQPIWLILGNNLQDT